MLAKSVSPVAASSRATCILPTLPCARRGRRWAFASPVQALGYLDPLLTLTGFQILPTVVWVDPAFHPQPDPDEVADVFAVPLELLMDPAQLDTIELQLGGRTPRVPIPLCTSAYLGCDRFDSVQPAATVGQCNNRENVMAGWTTVVQADIFSMALNRTDVVILGLPVFAAGSGVGRASVAARAFARCTVRASGARSVGHDPEGAGATPVAAGRDVRQ